MLTLGVEAAHHALKDVEFVLNSKIDEVGVDENVVGRTELRVVAKKQSRRYLRPAHRDVPCGGWKKSGLIRNRDRTEYR